MIELTKLIEEYNKSPEIFQAGRYWKAYENRIINEIRKADIEELRSGKYPIFATFGFNETVYFYHPSQPFYKKIIQKIIRYFFITDKHNLPYSLCLSDIREMAYNHCMLQGKLANIKSISEIEVSTFGKPEDLFEIKGKKYTMAFLSYYIRLCYAQKYLQLEGNEIVIELGSGSGHQVEVLKKVFPDLTILCFDLPYGLYLCYKYLHMALGEEFVVNPLQAIETTDLTNIEKGKVHMFGNWQFPLLQNFKFDVFWNAASFGEMEPHIVKNYLKYILKGCQAIYLLQARHGKESYKNKGVVTPIRFEDYTPMLNGFTLIDDSEAYKAHKKLSQSGGYFQAVWKKSN